MDNRREFLKKVSLLSGGLGLSNVLPAAVAKALAIDPAPGSTYLDAEHIVFLMQENRSFDHAFGSLQGVRGFNDPRAIQLPDKNKVWLQTNHNGDTYLPFRLDIKNTKATWIGGLAHSWSDQTDARNNGKHDKWLIAKAYRHDSNALPFTMGYYNREDIPFYYALADAFTICDQNFCSCLTGTTPNRNYFWTGTVRAKMEADALANVWNQDSGYEDDRLTWTAYPERLEDNGVSWKVYQNEISAGVGFDGEEDAWLSNFTDNNLEFLKQYQVKLSAAFIDNLPNDNIKLKKEIEKQEAALNKLTANSKEAIKTKNEIEELKKALLQNEKDQKVFTKEKYDQLSQRDKNLHDKAFSTSKNDPDYHKLTTLKYKDGDVEREMQVPKGDVFYQFREDVKNGQLPTVSWIVAPENFSDHPGAAWFGAWYMSEVMDILTKNPEVWEKTIFVLTYDENDGYFDHVPPFVAPHPDKSNGLTSSSINPAFDYVTSAAQQSEPDSIRIGPIGLGFRVPLVVASPWSRGGWVNSEVFDHTSSLQFLEHFLEHKTGKKIEETNITAWRRTVCGNLSSVFRPYHGEKIELPKKVEKDPFIESIYNAKFKNLPSNFKKLSAEEIAEINQHPHNSSLLPKQEKGIRSACALPYELYAHGKMSNDRQSFIINMKAADKAFGKNASGSPFQIYAPGNYQQELVRNWNYAVVAGDELKDTWHISDFENGQYHLRVYGPNGFYREFKGSDKDLGLDISCGYEKGNSTSQAFSGNLMVKLSNDSAKALMVEIIDNAYGTANRVVALSANANSTVKLDLQKSFGWYDFTIRIKGDMLYQQTFAGRIETGKPTKTDPFMGRAV